MPDAANNLTTEALLKIAQTRIEIEAQSKGQSERRAAIVQYIGKALDWLAAPEPK